MEPKSAEDVTAVRNLIIARHESAMSNPLRMLVREFGWIHLSLGLLGNVLFFAGSVLFLPPLEPYKDVGVWLFIVGSFLMLVGALGRLLVDIWNGH